MKRFIITTLVLYVFITDINAQALPDSVKPYFAGPLNSWLVSFNNCCLADFKHDETTSFYSKNIIQSGQSLDSFYALYKPALVFTKDSAWFIDLYSYELNLEKVGDKIIDNAEVDQKIAICNTASRTWQYVLFCGPSNRIEDACWINNNTFLLVGSTNDFNRSFHPKIYIANMQSKTIYVFIDTLSTNNGGYDLRLKKLNISSY